MATSRSARGAFAIVTVAVHAALVAAIALPAYFRVERVARPQSTTSMIPAAVSRPGGLGGSPSNPEEPDAKPKPNRVHRARTGRAPAKRPARPTPARAVETDGVEEVATGADADGAGQASGELGAGSGKGSGTAAAGGKLTPPVPLGNYARLKIPYTAAATRQKLRGVVRVQLSLDATGRVVSVRLVSGVGHGMDERAVALAKKFRFRPARDPRGAPIACQVDWRFLLDG